MTGITELKRKTESIHFKGFEILIQETNEGVVVDVYEAGENPSTGLLGSTQVFFNDLDVRNEKSFGFAAGCPDRRHEQEQGCGEKPFIKPLILPGPVWER